MAPTVKLQSSDNQFVEVDLEVVKQSGTLYTMIENLGFLEEGGDLSIPVPLPNVDSLTLGYILIWCREHTGDELLKEDMEPFENSIEKRVPVPEKDYELLNSVSKEQLLEIVKAASYLDIKLLLEYSCEVVADGIIGKTIPEIREAWKIENDYTHEEEELISRGNMWLDEEN